jgi:hypothetical protein
MKKRLEFKGARKPKSTIMDPIQIQKSDEKESME